MNKVIKRDGSVVPFDKTKIYNAIIKAMTRGSGIVKPQIATMVAQDLEDKFAKKETITIPEIEQYVFTQLVRYGQDLTARAYEGYRSVQEFKREVNTTDEGILGLINATNHEVMTENSNKDSILLPTQRDLIAGEVSKDISRRFKLPAHIVQAHDDGVLHFHDLDYYAQSMHNCELINIGDMLDNGTVINKRMIESPKSFQVACTVLTQIVAQVASSKYGGTSVNIKHLGKYLQRSKENYIDMFKNEFDGSELDLIVEKLIKKELKSGVQTIQYQINTLLTTNGQSPFLTLFLDIDENSEYINEIADIVEEIIKQRLEGLKNEKGVPTTPSFPKLVYPLYEHNNLTGGKYDYITKLCAKCSSKRLYPDYISTKIMKNTYEGNVFSPMGK